MTAKRCFLASGVCVAIAFVAAILVTPLLSENAANDVHEPLSATTDRVIVPEKEKTDVDIAGIPFVLDLKEFYRALTAWNDVADDVSREVIIAIDRLCYLGEPLGGARIAKRHVLYGRQPIAIFAVQPLAVHRDAEKGGYEVHLALRPQAPSKRGKREAFPVNRVHIEQWHYAPEDGTLTFERIVKAVQTPIDSWDGDEFDEGDKKPKG